MKKLFDAKRLCNSISLNQGCVLSAKDWQAMKLKSETVLQSIDNAFLDSESDFFDFRDLIDRLTSMYSKMEGGTVAILDGKWGSGKTTFCKAWSNNLINKGFPALYFDAFSVDLNASPYEALSGAIMKRAHELQAESTPKYKKFVDAAARVGKSLAGSATNVAIRAASMGLVGEEDLKSAGDAGKTLVDRLADGGEGAVKRALEAQAKSAEDVNAFKAALADLPSLLAPPGPENMGLPLVFIVDELDRCRPDFALGVIEILKHLFDAKGVNFIISTHVPQLIRSVNHRYGIGEFSNEYLEKFYDFTINFTTGVGQEGRRATRRFISHLANELQVGDSDTRYEIARYLQNSLPNFEPSLRQIEKVFLNLILIFPAKEDREKYDNFIVIYLTILMVMRRDLYVKARSGILKYEEMNEFLQIQVWDEDGHFENVDKIFKFYLDKSVDASSSEWRGFSSNFRLGRMETIKYYCKNVIERFSVKS